jgi:hypothetical protein
VARLRSSGAAGLLLHHHVGLTPALAASRGTAHVAARVRPPARHVERAAGRGRAVAAPRSPVAGTHPRAGRPRAASPSRASDRSTCCSCLPPSHRDRGGVGCSRVSTPATRSYRSALLPTTRTDPCGPDLRTATDGARRRQPAIDRSTGRGDVRWLTPAPPSGRGQLHALGPRRDDPADRPVGDLVHRGPGTHRAQSPRRTSHGTPLVPAPGAPTRAAHHPAGEQLRLDVVTLQRSTWLELPDAGSWGPPGQRRWGRGDVRRSRPDRSGLGRSRRSLDLLHPLVSERVPHPYRGSGLGDGATCWTGADGTTWPRRLPRAGARPSRPDTRCGAWPVVG